MTNPLSPFSALKESALPNRRNVVFNSLFSVISNYLDLEGLAPLSQTSRTMRNLTVEFLNGDKLIQIRDFLGHLIQQIEENYPSREQVIAKLKQIRSNFSIPTGRANFLSLPILKGQALNLRKEIAQNLASLSFEELIALERNFSVLQQLPYVPADFTQIFYLARLVKGGKLAPNLQEHRNKNFLMQFIRDKLFELKVIDFERISVESLQEPLILRNTPLFFTLWEQQPNSEKKWEKLQNLVLNLLRRGPLESEITFSQKTAQLANLIPLHGNGSFTCSGEKKAAFCFKIVYLYAKDLILEAQRFLSSYVLQFQPSPKEQIQLLLNIAEIASLKKNYNEFKAACHWIYSLLPRVLTSLQADCLLASLSSDPTLNPPGEPTEFFKSFKGIILMNLVEYHFAFSEDTTPFADFFDKHFYEPLVSMELGVDLEGRLTIALDANQVLTKILGMEEFDYSKLEILLNRILYPEDNNFYYQNEVLVKIIRRLIATDHPKALCLLEVYIEGFLIHNPETEAECISNALELLSLLPQKTEKIYQLARIVQGMINEEIRAEELVEGENFLAWLLARYGHYAEALEIIERQVPGEWKEYCKAIVLLQ